MRQTLSRSWKFLTSKIHQPLPLNRRDSHKLLTLLNDSFNRNLDRHYPQGLAGSEQSPDDHVKSVLENPLFGNHRTQTSSLPSRKHDLNHNAANIRDQMFAVKDPVEFFKKRVADGTANVATAKLALESQSRLSLSSAASDPKESMKQSRIGTSIVSWLWSSGQFDGMNFIKDTRFISSLLPFAVAECQYKHIWEWLQRSFKICAANDLPWDARIAWQKNISFLIKTVLKAEVSHGQGLQSAIQMFLTSQKSTTLASPACSASAVSSVHKFGGSYLIKTFALHKESAAVEDSVIESLNQSVDHWASGLLAAGYKALLELSHPRTPSTSRALELLSSLEGSEIQLGKGERPLVVGIGLKTVELLLEKGFSGEAASLMKLLQTHFAPEVGYKIRPPETSEDNEKSVLRSLNLLLAT
ncbi:MAG: hypothetical protein Q9222_003461 [Ikaeria aurantiellina]